MKTITKNILSINSGVIAHCVNCKKVMGAGLALQLRNKYPKMYTVYKKKNWVLGDVQIVKVSQNLYVANCAGQEGYGRGLQLSYDGLEVSLDRLMRAIRENSDLPKELYLPYGIGCGLAGGRWPTVYEILDRLSSKYSDLEITICKYLP